MATALDVKIRKLNKSGTIKVVISKEFKVRLAIAMAFFKLGAWVIGVGCEYEEPEGTG